MRELDVLLLDAEHRQSLAALRVLSRAGLRVGSVASESEAWWAPALVSRFAALRARVPDLGNDAGAYVDGVLRLLDQHPAQLLVPSYDGTIQAIRTRRAEFERRTALPLATEAALDIAISKTRTLGLAQELGMLVPRSIPIGDTADLPAALNEVGLPAVIKPIESWVERDGKGVRLSPNVVQTLDEARDVFEHVLAEGGHALVQQWLPGSREAVTLFYARGEFWASLAQKSYREWPVLGGASVLSETIPLLPDITSAARALVRAIGLEGCSMVEFRRDRIGQPVLMEVNPRMGGSVGLAVAAGVNFPQMLFDWKVTERLHHVDSYRVGKRLRWLAGDVWNLKCAFEMQGHPDIDSPAATLRRFLLDFTRPGNTLDGFDVHDLRPSVAEFDRMLLRHAMRRARHLLTSERAP